MNLKLLDKRELVRGKDLKKALEKMELSYEMYVNRKDKCGYIKENVENLRKRQKKLIEKIFLERLDRVYRGEAVYYERMLLNVVCEELGVINIEKVYEKYINFIRKYPEMEVRKNKYEFFVKLIMNFVEKGNDNKAIRDKDYLFEKDYIEFSKFIDEISRLENKYVTYYFKYALYKKLKKYFGKIGRSEREESISKEIEYEVGEEIFDYKIKEEFKVYNEEVFVEKIIKKRKIEKIEARKLKEIKILLLIDLQYKEVEKTLREYNYLLNKVEIFKIKNLKDVGDIIEFEEDEIYDQIVIMSEIDLKNVVKNRGDKPIFMIKVKNGKNKKKERMRDSIELYEK